ncbi:MAG TPA: ABC transporter ATP-binding protein [Actinomycetota bacterium]|nr:ABC transporter ATP-binding protein [Actinomycetota bacterium]
MSRLREGDRGQGPGSAGALLRVSGLTVRYGPVVAVRGVSFDVREGEIVTLLGANGAGKSTTLNAIVGLVKPAGGEIRYGPHDLRSMPTEDVVRLGVGLVPERRRLFSALTVAENLRLGARATGGRADLGTRLRRVFDLFPVLERRYRSPTGTLSGGEQQMLAIARALMGRPRVLLLDEPSLGLAPRVVEQLFGLLRALRDQGVTLVLVEQNVAAALELADRGYVLQAGRVVLSGPATELLESREILGAYLGARHGRGIEAARPEVGA